MNMNKKNQLKECLVELLKIDAAIGDLIECMEDASCEMGDDTALHDVETMSKFSDQAIARLRAQILKEA